MPPIHQPAMQAELSANSIFRYLIGNEFFLFDLLTEGIISLTKPN